MNILVLMNSVVLMLPTGTAGYLILILVLSLLVVLLAIKNRKLVCEKKQYKDLLDDMQILCICFHLKEILQPCLCAGRPFHFSKKDSGKLFPFS